MSTVVRRGVGQAEQTILDRVAEAIHEDIGELSQLVLDNKCKTAEDYRHQTGRIRGLRKALERIDEVRKRYLEE